MPRKPDPIRTALQALGGAMLALMPGHRRGRPVGAPVRTQVTYPGGTRGVVLDMRGPDGAVFRAVDTGMPASPVPARAVEASPDRIRRQA